MHIHHSNSVAQAVNQLQHLPPASQKSALDFINRVFVLIPHCGKFLLNFI